MSNALLIREGTQSDAIGVANLHALSWQTNYRGEYKDEYLNGPVLEDRLNTWRSRFDSPANNMHLVVATIESEIVGFSCVFGGESIKWGSFLDNLHVNPEYQSSGIGEKLMMSSFGWCRKHHSDQGLYLWVLASNKRAQAFYSRLGAIDCGGEYSDAPGGGTIHGRRYVWHELPTPP